MVLLGTRTIIVDRFKEIVYSLKYTKTTYFSLINQKTKKIRGNYNDQHIK